MFFDISITKKTFGANFCENPVKAILLSLFKYRLAIDIGKGLKIPKHLYFARPIESYSHIGNSFVTFIVNDNSWSRLQIIIVTCFLHL